MALYTRDLSPSNHKYGWKPSLPDHRDHWLGISVVPANLPPSVDLRPGCPPIFNQKSTNSCTANALAGAMDFNHLKENLSHNPVSRLFIYYAERVIDGTTELDCGSTLRDGIQVGYQTGAPDEDVWPFDETKVTTVPSQEAYTQASTHKITGYQRLQQDVNSLKAVLAQGTPFVFGFSVYTEFESTYCAQTGILTMPQSASSFLGGHAVMAVGYNDSGVYIGHCPPGNFIIRNSWGPEWGDNGYFFMPFGLISNPNLASDFWAVQTST